MLIAAAVVSYVGYRVVKEIGAWAAAERERIEGLRARADQQYNWRMQGDPRGTYGEFPPAAT